MVVVVVVVVVVSSSVSNSSGRVTGSVGLILLSYRLVLTSSVIDSMTCINVLEFLFCAL